MEPLFQDLGIRVEQFVVCQFRYENSSTYEADCRQIIKENWQGVVENRLEEKLYLCSLALQSWSRNFHHAFKVALAECKRRLAFLRWNSHDPNCLEIKKVEDVYANLLQQQNLYWRQRAKQHWLAHGDSNTKYFHVMANHRRKNNTVKRLKNDQGE